MATVYCLDASACSLLSEDWGPALTRFHFQKELVGCLSRSCLSDATGSGTAAGSDPSSTPGQQHQVVLIASSSGRASVALHPCSAAAALQQALAEVQPVGEANLEATLKLALLVSRRFEPGSTHITAFVASAGAAASLTVAAAEELWQRFRSAEVGLDVAVLCPREELGAGTCQVLEALAGSNPASSSTTTALHAVAETSAAGASSVRIVWLSPVATAVENWQQLEPALEQLEWKRSSSSSTSRNRSRSTPRGPSSSSSSTGPPATVPRRISRAPRQYDPQRHPRAPLLALRSGVQQPALCRGESLNRFGHLSSDGMARPWLPTYASIGQQAAAAAAAAGRGAGSAVGEGREVVYVEVQPIPKWRTLLKVAAGRMVQQAADSSSSSSSFAAASSQLLSSLEALSVSAEQEHAPGSSHTSQLASDCSCGSSSDVAATPSSSSSASSSAGQSADGSNGRSSTAAAVSYRPDSRRGMLRLLQATKEPEVLKLVWSADVDPSVASSAAEQPLDMFSGDESGSSRSSAASSGASSAHASLLGYMPAATLAASVARGPIVREDGELWETAAEWELELTLATEPDGGDSAALPAAVEARQLPNGAQVLLVTPTRRARRRQPTTAAFWLQQRLSADSLRLPQYGTAASSSEAEPSPESQLQQASQPELQQAAAAAPTEQEPAHAASEVLAAALLRLLRRPPAVDLRRLRRDVKAGAIQVTPITVGPLPAQFVRDIVATRSALMGGMGVENLDSWDTSADAGDSSAASAAADAATRDKEAAGSGGGAPLHSAQSSTAASAKAAGISAAAAAAAMRRHKTAVLSLLRQRLHNRHKSGDGGGGTSAVPEPCPASAAQQGGPVAASEEPACEAPAAVAAAIPCTPQHAAHRTAVADSYGSSGAATPFGTPLHILPSELLHHHHAGAAEGPAASEPASATAAVAHDTGLPGEAVKPDGPAVLVGAASQADRGDGDPHMFQLE